MIKHVLTCNLYAQFILEIDVHFQGKSKKRVKILFFLGGERGFRAQKGPHLVSNFY